MNLGVMNEVGTVIGTYIHGFLDKDLFRENILRYIRRKNGLPEPQRKFDYSQFRAQELNKLTELIKTSINMEEIKKIFSN